jgi:hypothetical protein
MLKKYRELFEVQEEYMLPGGRSCIGCAGGILTRIAFKAVGPKTILSSGSCGTNTTGMFPIGAIHLLSAGHILVPRASRGRGDRCQVTGNEDANFGDYR